MFSDKEINVCRNLAWFFEEYFERLWLVERMIYASLGHPTFKSEPPEYMKNIVELSRKERLRCIYYADPTSKQLLHTAHKENLHTGMIRVIHFLQTQQHMFED